MPQNISFLVGQRNVTKGTRNILVSIKIKLGEPPKPQNLSFLVGQRTVTKVNRNIRKSCKTNLASLKNHMRIKPGKPPKLQNVGLLVGPAFDAPRLQILKSSRVVEVGGRGVSL